MRKFTFGLDFGTSKTAITLARVDLNAPITDVAIDSTQRKRIPTCVLRKHDTDQVWIGYPAEEEIMMETDPDTRARLEFSANFKPHIHQNPDDRETARRFMIAIARAEGLSRQLARHADDAVVAAGCPVSWAADGAATLMRLLKEAGFPPAFAVPEPVGAALYFFAKGELQGQDLHRDIVVFDWGAGTFDMTLLRADRLKFQSDNTWGSTIYGGRLFDDLFYQWLLEIAQQKGHQADIDELDRRPPSRAFLHGLICREIKESFSAAYSTATANDEPDKSWTYRFAVTIGAGDGRIDLGDFSVPHLSDLSRRMQAYRVSDMARPWLERSRDEIRPVEREFVDALLNGDAADLEAWGKALIAEGLSKFNVGRNAVAVLTGGSCNWRWFRDQVRSQRTFAGGDVHIDDEPELTIARGLARAYTVGLYSKRLAGLAAAHRSEWIPALCEIHKAPLDELSHRISAEMRNDMTLQDNIQQIFTESYRAALAGAAPHKHQGTVEALLDWLKGLFGRVIRDDPNEQALRPKLEREIGDWLLANEVTLQRRWGERFAAAAHRSIMALLKKDLDLEGLVEVAVEACSAIGPTSFDVALKELGGRVKFGPDMVSKIYGEISRLIVMMTGAAATPQDTDAAVRKQAVASTKRFFDAMPDAIWRNITEVQPPEQWAQHVVDDLIGTLQTLADFANAEGAARLDESLRPG